MKTQLTLEDIQSIDHKKLSNTLFEFLPIYPLLAKKIEKLALSTDTNQ